MCIMGLPFPPFVTSLLFGKIDIGNWNKIQAFIKIIKMSAYLMQAGD